MNRDDKFGSEGSSYDDTPIEPVNFRKPPRREEPVKRSPVLPPDEPSSPKRKFSEQKGPPKRPKKIQNRWGRAFLISFALIGVAIFLAFFAIESANDLFGLNQEDRQIEVVITDKMSSSQIVNELEKKGVITQELTFKLYAMLGGSSSKFQAGTYLLNSNMSYDEIIIALKTGDSVKTVVKVTFYEGMSMREIANLLEEKEVCSAQEFLEFMDTASFEYDFEQKLPKDDKRFRKYEGYLFPDTYEFYVGESPSRVAKRFLSNFENKITDELNAKMKNMNLTLDQTITLASIIQEEASAPEQMANVSSVFHNRMASEGTFPRLESDVTIFYVEKDIKPYLDKHNQPMYDAYNTYVCEGLPVGPICNPGMDAIEAALNPADTNYLFFVTDKSGKFYFAETADEHYRNVRTAAKVDETIAAEKAKEAAAAASASASASSSN